MIQTILRDESGLMLKVSAFQTRDLGFESKICHNHVFSYGTSTG